MTRSMSINPLIAGFQQRIQECNIGLEELNDLIPLVVDGQRIGRTKRNFADQLLKWPSVFTERDGQLIMDAAYNNQEMRSSAMARILSQLRQDGVISGWRDELYPVSSSFYDEPVMLVERAAAVQLGIRAYGVHVNGFVRKGAEIFLWVARRSLTKPTWPGKLDHIAAGGQPYGISVMDNVIKECEEEAGIPFELAKMARSCGVVSYATIDERGLKPDVLFVFDLELPSDFLPKPNDGEVESFTLFSLPEVARLIATTTEFKTNCSLVLIDFMIRHGHCLKPDDLGYLSIVQSLKQGNCSS